jgi:hypothetical protein
MYQFVKKIMLGLALVALVGCSAQDMQSQIDGATAAKLSDSPVIPVEGSDPIEVTSNNLPVDASDVPNELLKLINEPPKPEGFLSGLLGRKRLWTFKFNLISGGFVFNWGKSTCWIISVEPR